MSRSVVPAIGQVICALPQLVEQARILDGDDGLVGKVLEQRELLVRERLDSSDTTIAPPIVFAAHRGNIVCSMPLAEVSCPGALQ